MKTDIYLLSSFFKEEATTKRQSLWPNFLAAVASMFKFGDC